MPSNSQNPSPPPACPLARDLDGRPIEVPENAATWRVRRHTGGRPRILLGVDKQPIQLPLSYTLADLEDILPPGTYRIDLVDAKGEFAGMTVPVTIGQPHIVTEDDERNDGAPAVATSVLPHTASDTRLVLEANVRSTQMAFQHNEKTLELGLRMAETLRDGVHVLVEAQADWIKSIASSRGFFRNAPPPLLLAPPEPSKREDDENDGDDGDEDDGARQPDWVAQVTPIVAIVAQQVVTTLVERFSKPATAASGDSKAGSKFDIGDLFDWKRAHAKSSARRAEEHTTAAAPPPPASPMDLLMKMPPALVHKVMQVRGILSPDEQLRAMQLISAFDPADLPALAAHVESMSVEDLATFLRAQIAKAA